MVSKKSRSEVRRKKHMKLRNRFSGTAQRPRLAVFRSNNHMYAQIIDDTVGNTLVSASTLQKEVKAELEKTNDVEAAAYLGKVIAERAKAKGIDEVVFDRGGFIYQGKIKACTFKAAFCRYTLNRCLPSLAVQPVFNYIPFDLFGQKAFTGLFVFKPFSYYCR